MLKDRRNIILEKLLEKLELPEGAYEKANNRYQDLGDWFSRSESTVKVYGPHIFTQGSFRLGTAIKPLEEGEPYDLDISCKLSKGISIETHSQKQLKSMVGVELEKYRIARRIQEKVQEKHRCWRLRYQDDMEFHMDVVPSIPVGENKSKHIIDILVKSGMSKDLAYAEGETTSVITDNRLPSFNAISSDWKISNPEGYAKWFERRVREYDTNFDILKKAQVDKMPLFKRKAPLQQVIQLLKRHRDQMFSDNLDIKPISIIITTLATHAYSGEQDLAQALTNILNKMENYVRSSFPRVPNPVDPEEDFADKWGTQHGKSVNLEGNFRIWLNQAKIDFETIFTSDSVQLIGKYASGRLGTRLDEPDLAKSLGMDASVVFTTKKHSITGGAPPHKSNKNE